MKPKTFKNESRMSNDARIAVLETNISNINATLLDFKQEMRHSFDKVDKQFDALETKFDAQDKKFETKFNALNNRLWTNFLWIMASLFGLAGLIARTQHWI